MIEVLQLKLQLDYANNIFWISINHFGGKSTPRLGCLKNISNEIFGQRLSGYNSEFSVTLKQIKDADITIKPTNNLIEHLLYKKGVLYLLELSDRWIYVLVGLENNLIAQ